MIEVERFTVYSLTNDKAVCESQSFFVVDGKEYPKTEPIRTGYINSIKDREKLAAEVSEPYLTAIMAVWGDAPTVTEELI